jgi:hypothetical protein
MAGMNVGESFWLAQRHEWCARWNAKKLGIKIELRAEEGGFRVWRKS